MIFLLSPAKSLDFETPIPEHLPSTIPLFLKPAGELIEILRTKTNADISELMDLSGNLSDLNVARYAAWRPGSTPKNAKQAVLAFNGDVYDGLNAKTLTNEDLIWAQDHVLALSGLYAVLRPLDLMQPYRLEMGTALTNPRGKNLYQFWGSTVSDHLNKQLKAIDEPVVVNLASQEYFKVVDKKVLKARVIECVFEEHKNGAYKIISFMAKRARGLMTRYAVQNRIVHPEDLKRFTTEGYGYVADQSTSDRWVFRRKVAI
jgi:cytoplasmic iron level regulating protein YaaA (DUF328/UPF0246 family)